MEPINSKLLGQKNQMQQVQIDQQWISASNKHSHMIDPNLVMCMICFGIPLGEFAECVQCGRIFCQKDYKKVLETVKSCPNCKNIPFAKKAKPHILYTSLFERLTFECKICSEEKQKHEEKQKEKYYKQEDKKMDKSMQMGKQQVKLYTKQQLLDHINEYHKAKIMDFCVLYDFEIIFDKGDHNLVFDKYQNMELNQKLFQIQNDKKGLKNNIPYQLDDGSYIMIDLMADIVSSIKLGKIGKLIKRPSKQLKKGIEYEVWEIALDYGWKYYTKEYQERIIKQHHEYVKNKRKNQFCFDISDQRYRISFKRMVQINTYTDYERAIKKTIVKFT